MLRLSRDLYTKIFLLARQWSWWRATQIGMCKASICKKPTAWLYLLKCGDSSTESKYWRVWIGLGLRRGRPSRRQGATLCSLCRGWGSVPSPTTPLLVQQTRTRSHKARHKTRSAFSSFGRGTNCWAFLLAGHAQKADSVFRRVCAAIVLDSAATAHAEVIIPLFVS